MIFASTSLGRLGNCLLWQLQSRPDSNWAECELEYCPRANECTDHLCNF